MARLHGATVRPALGAERAATHHLPVMRHGVIAGIGAASMVAAWLVFVSAFADGGPLGSLLGDTAMLLVPGVAIAGGVVAALLDGGLRAYTALLAGAAATVIAFAAWTAAFGQGTETGELVAIGVGFAVSTLSVGFISVAALARLSGRRRPGR